MLQSQREIDSRGARLKVAVVGGGIGGLTATLALLKAGVDVTCFESSSDLRESGAGIQIGPNASRILLQLGLDAELMKIGVRPVAIEIRRWDSGVLLQRLPGHPNIELAFGAPYITLHRAELHAALHARVPPHVLQLGATCTGISHHAQGIELRFADGRRAQADVAVGADGLRSTLRAELEASPPRFSGKLACRVLVPAESVRHLADPPMVRMWLGPGVHVVSYPVSGGRLLNLAAALPARQSAIESWTREGEVEEMAQALRGWHDDIHSILRAAHKTLRLPLFDRASLRRVGVGRLTLLGDAAHPMLPFFAQGAAQAIEDAWILARCLRGAQSDRAAECLRRYERARARRTADVQRRSVRNGKLFQLPDGLRRRGRDLLLRRLALGSFAWLYAYDAERVPI
jgi:salicylate hydroxylase